MELLKAELIELKPSDPPEEVPGSALPVQFNPTTLRLQISNQAEGGDAQGRPARQYIATSTVLTLDLVFDTADEGTTDGPRSVRERTAMVERFVLPKEEGSEAPPKLRFKWGDGLQFDGVVSSVNVDFEHFAANGVPLRARVGLSLTEQDAKYQVVPSSTKAKARQPGENKPGLPGSAGLSGGLSGGLSAGLGLSAGIGLSAGFGFSASASLALGGETAAGFAARVGLDPGAWRGLEVDLSAGLTLEAGVEVGFDASLSASTGLGAAVGFGAGVDASVEASFGLEADASVSAGYSAAIGGSLDPQLGAGFALAAAGGVTSAVESVRIVKTTEAAEASRQAFALPSSPEAPARPGLPEQPRTPLALSGVPSPARQAAALPAPRPPRVDPRAASFGFGVPLRPTVPVDARPAPARHARKARAETKGRPCGCGCGGKR